MPKLFANFIIKEFHPKIADTFKWLPADAEINEGRLPPLGPDPPEKMRPPRQNAIPSLVKSIHVISMTQNASQISPYKYGHPGRVNCRSFPEPDLIPLPRATITGLVSTATVIALPLPAFPVLL